MPHRLLLLLVLASLLAAEDAAPPAAADPTSWAVVSTTDASGRTALDLLGLSGAGTAAPEYKAAVAAAQAVYQDAKTAWDARRQAWEADAANAGKSFRKIEAEPVKPVVRLVGAPLKDKAKAEDALAKAQQDLLAKSDPGAARRLKVMNEQLLPCFTIGIQATAGWILDTREKQGDRWACMAGYLSHVVDTPNDTEGKDTWFFKYGGLRGKFEDCRKAKVICWNTWYGLAEAPPAKYQPTPAKATPVNAKVQSTMIAYWSLVKKFMQMAKEFEDVDCVLQIEPDEWGHLLLSCGFDGKKDGVILVGGSGLPELKGIPDSVAGWARGFRLLRDQYAPHVLLAANPSAWDRNGTMSGQAWAGYFKAMEVDRQHGWDLFITQLHDWDRGQDRNGGNAKWPPYTEADTVTYHGSVDNWCAWIEPIHQGTGMWGVAWQLPQGNWTYAACDGSAGHGMDNVTELLLDNYPSNRVAQRMAAAGCCMWIFSLGGEGANVDDARKDGVTNPSPHSGNKGKKSDWPDDDGGYLRLKGAEYFRNPVPILAKPGKVVKPRPEPIAAVAAPAGESSGEPAEAKPAPAPAAAAPAPKATSAARAAFDARLVARTIALAKAGKGPGFRLAAMQADAVVEAADEEDLALRLGGTVMHVAWGTLGEADRLALALDLARSNSGPDHAQAAFRLLIAGRRDEAQAHLAQAGDGAAEVAAAFR